MIKSSVFEVGLLDQYHIYIPEQVMQPFIDKQVKRLLIKASYNKKAMHFYAAFVKDKNTDDFRIMFGKHLQKQLGVLQNDYFKVQLFEDNSKYGVDVPEELDAVFKSDVEAFTLFENLTAGKKRSIIYAISRFKNSQIRIDKSLIMCDNLKRGHLDPYTILKPKH